MPANGDKLPSLYNSNSNFSHQRGRDSSLNRRKFDNASSSPSAHQLQQQQRSKSRFGHRGVDYNRRLPSAALGGSQSALNSNAANSPRRSMEGNASERNWDSEGGRPKSPQRQPIPHQTKKTGFRKLLQRSSFDGLIPFQRAPRDGSYEKTLPISSKSRNSKSRDDARISRKKDAISKQSQKLDESDGNDYKDASTYKQSKSNAPLNSLNHNVRSPRSGAALTVGAKSYVSQTPRSESSHIGAKKHQTKTKTNANTRTHVPIAATISPRQQENSAEATTPRQGPPSFTKLLRRRHIQDGNTTSLENAHSYPNYPNMSSRPTTTETAPLPLSSHNTLIDNTGPTHQDYRSQGVSESSLEREVTETNIRNDNSTRSGAREADHDLQSLPNNPAVSPRQLSGGSTHFTAARDRVSLSQVPIISDSALLDLIPTRPPIPPLNNESSTTSPRDPYSTLTGIDNLHSYSNSSNSSPLPPPRTSASLSVGNSLPRTAPSRDDMQQQPNSVYRQQPFVRRVPEESSQDSPRQRANSERSRISSSARLRNLLSRRDNSGSPRESAAESTTPPTPQPQGTSNRNNGDREGSSSRSFWRNSLFGRLGSAERRSRSRSDASAGATQSSSSQRNMGRPPSPHPATLPAADPEEEFHFRPRPAAATRDRGPAGLNRNDQSVPDLSSPRIIRLTIGPSGIGTGTDLGSLLPTLLSSSRGQSGESSDPASGANTSVLSDADHLGLQIALMGSPMLSPQVDLTTIPPRLLLSFLLQGRRELGNEFVELVLENLLLSILARHMMEVGGQGGNGGAHPPATQDMIDKLEEIIVDQKQIDEDLNCAICHVEYVLSESLSKLPCKHFFHPTCITLWLKKSATCPVCRFKLNRPGQTPTAQV